jgi:hypothetical protein
MHPPIVPVGEHSGYGAPVTAPGVTRTDPPSLGDERSMLDAWIDYYRATVLHKCAGLSPEQLVERSCPPSPMSLIGLVRHLTEMERAYGHRLADPQTPLYYCTDANPEADFEDVSPAAVDEDLKIYVEHCASSRTIMAGFGLDDRFGRTSSYSLRWVYLYLIKEYARHCGHADLLRERVDGATGE